MEKEDLRDRFLKKLSEFDYLLISYSGDVDSTLLTVLSQKALHERVKLSFLMRLLSHDELLVMQKRLQVS